MATLLLVLFCLQSCHNQSIPGPITAKGRQEQKELKVHTFNKKYLQVEEGSASKNIEQSSSFVILHTNGLAIKAEEEINDNFKRYTSYKFSNSKFLEQVNNASNVSTYGQKSSLKQKVVYKPEKTQRTHQSKVFKEAQVTDKKENETFPFTEEPFTAQGGHTVTFYHYNGQIHASVEIVNEKDKVFNYVPVIIKKGADLTRVLKMPRYMRENRISIQFTRDKQPSEVVIHKVTGILGGMEEGDQNNEEDKEKNKLTSKGDSKGTMKDDKEEVEEGEKLYYWQERAKKAYKRWVKGDYKNHGLRLKAERCFNRACKAGDIDEEGREMLEKLKKKREEQLEEAEPGQEAAILGLEERTSIELQEAIKELDNNTQTSQGLQADIKTKEIQIDQLSEDIRLLKLKLGSLKEELQVKGVSEEDERLNTLKSIKKEIKRKNKKRQRITNRSNDLKYIQELENSINIERKARIDAEKDREFLETALLSEQSDNKRLQDQIDRLQESTTQTQEEKNDLELQKKLNKKIERGNSWQQFVTKLFSTTIGGYSAFKEHETGIVVTVLTSTLALINFTLLGVSVGHTFLSEIINYVKHKEIENKEIFKEILKDIINEATFVLSQLCMVFAGSTVNDSIVAKGTLVGAGATFMLISLFIGQTIIFLFCKWFNR